MIEFFTRSLEQQKGYVPPGKCQIQSPYELVRLIVHQVDWDRLYTIRLDNDW
jgi:hypothetical protein